jgi:signal transduction histidine kinase
MERFIHGKNIGEIACVETKLAGDVLTKLSSIHKSMTKFYNVIPEPGPIFDHSKMLEIPTVYGEEEALITVFRNLAENSVKYSSRTTKLKTWVNWKVEGNYLMVDFIDNGIGIEKVDIDYIFSEGYKAENAMRRSTVGAGLGLFQCKKILKKLKGDIWLKKASNPTIFTVKLQLWDK